MKRKLLVFNFLSIIILTGFSQTDTIIYLAGNNKPSDKVNAISYFEIKKVSKKQYVISEFQKFEDNWHPSFVDKVKILNDSTLKLTKYYKNNKQSVTIRKLTQEENGLYYFKDYYENGNLKLEGRSSKKFPLSKIVEINEYHKNGAIKKKSIYKENQLLSNQIWNEDGTKYLDNIFEKVDLIPEFPGGLAAFSEFIAKNVKYPEVAKINKIQGRVFVKFVVLEDGSITGVKIDRGIDPSLDKAAIEVIKSINKKWKPGILDGKKVRVSFTAPINFVLN